MLSKELLITAVNLGKKYAVPAIMGVVAAKNCMADQKKEAEFEELKKVVSELQKKVMGS